MPSSVTGALCLKEQGLPVRECFWMGVLLWYSRTSAVLHLWNCRFAMLLAKSFVNMLSCRWVGRSQTVFYWYGVQYRQETCLKRSPTLCYILERVVGKTSNIHWARGPLVPWSPHIPDIPAYHSCVCLCGFPIGVSKFLVSSVLKYFRHSFMIKWNGIKAKNNVSSWAHNQNF